MDTPEQIRVRVNVSRSVKGVYTFDCTAELVVDAHLTTSDDGVGVRWATAEEKEAHYGGVRKAVLDQSDALVTALDAKYPQVEV